MSRWILLAAPWAAPAAAQSSETRQVTPRGQVASTHQHWDRQDKDMAFDLRPRSALDCYRDHHHGAPHYGLFGGNARGSC